MGNILMQAVTENWLETTNGYRKSKCLKNYIQLQCNSSQKNPNDENLVRLQNEQSKATDAHSSNTSTYIKTNSYINKER